MAGKLSPHAQVKLASLRALADKVQSAYAQVERYAATREPRQAEMLAQPMKRAFGRLKIELMGAGQDAMSQLAGAMEIAAGRGGSQRQKTRILREGVASLRFQMELEERQIISEDQAAQAKEKEAPPADAP